MALLGRSWKDWGFALVVAVVVTVVALGGLLYYQRQAAKDQVIRDLAAQVQALNSVVGYNLQQGKLVVPPGK